MLVFLVSCGLADSAASAAEQRVVVGCSSLDGPKCPLINGRHPSSTTTKENEKKNSWRERLVDVVQKQIQDSVQANDDLGGSFEMSGSVPDKDGRFVLKPGAWIDEPEGWITVGLQGQFEDNVTLSGFITDPVSGEILEACTRFALQRRLDDDEEEEGSMYEELSLAGTWQGLYICGGTATRLLLELRTDHATFASHVDGIFQFVVLRDLSSDELETLTELISESLMDIASPRGENVEIFLFDSATGDLVSIPEDDGDDQQEEQERSKTTERNSGR